MVSLILGYLFALFCMRTRHGYLPLELCQDTLLLLAVQISLSPFAMGKDLEEVALWDGCQL